MDAARDLAARAEFGKDRRGLATRRRYHIGGERLELDIVARHQGRERFRVEALHLRKRKARFRRASVGNDCLGLGVSGLPGLERDDALAGAVRLVEPWPVIERRDAI